MEKVQSKQEIKSFGVISLFLLVGCSLVVLSPVWSGGAKKDPEIVLRRAESLAYQIIEIRQGPSRGPASAAEAALNHLFVDQGEIGLDPWGRPYQFTIIKSEMKDSKVVVWSLGQNGKSDSDSQEFASKQDDGTLKMSGDDLGIIVSIK